MPRRLQAIDII
ncbi:hypothetical protein ANOM_011846 [Aspergillus nomiae NRRL 13137]|uniref:Uncharacterized protein n=1 Tax=Aspergillus nomiae NRRL (strain ATCC 15546 / NRRL 13137 / CBS 260.88 / M93) TaxID=1509407 RepID=A0A0L1IKX9_ASPN3|nr:hypothetical protein ANOM_011846 [Aspergillus nomiae NRRL 13137]